MKKNYDLVSEGFWLFSIPRMNMRRLRFIPVETFYTRDICKGVGWKILYEDKNTETGR